MLDRKLTSRGHYPPINVLNSLSRVMPMVTSKEHIQQANSFRELIAAYDDVEDLVSVGAYKPGSQPISDMAIAKWPMAVRRSCDMRASLPTARARSRPRERT